VRWQPHSSFSAGYLRILAYVLIPAGLYFQHVVAFQAVRGSLCPGCFLTIVALQQMPWEAVQAFSPLDAACVCSLPSGLRLVVCAVKNKVQFFVLRLLLGVSESGAFPGMW
jgi:hypothetical protein